MLLANEITAVAVCAPTTAEMTAIVAPDCPAGGVKVVPNPPVRFVIPDELLSVPTLLLIVTRRPAIGAPAGSTPAAATFQTPVGVPATAGAAKIANEVTVAAVKVRALEVPPPGPGLVTVTWSVAGAAKSAAGTIAVSCVGETVVVLS